ncbi:MAG: LysM peptidoglycan-binding domain-containing protein [Planctomycetota bacterium]|nr:LysM peptidoglycan-binding domain-containing protein [Planctomycetota bacterium]
MGKVEKVIVLSVLFLIALILVVSLTVDDPLNKTGVVEAGAPPARRNAVPIVPASEAEMAAAKASRDAAGLLSSQIPSTASVAGSTAGAALIPAPIVTPPANQVPPADVAQPALVAVATPLLPASALLKKLDGLQDSILPDMKLYTWKEGDSYKLIANNYYGNWQKLTVLKRSNEGRTDVQPGQTIFVPVFDTDIAPVTKTAVSKASPSKGASAKEAAVSTGGRVHVVKDGESLWKIAKLELGNGDRWKEIFELNKDVLAKPESVHKGMRLRLP